MSESIYTIFKRSPKEALEEKFRRDSHKYMSCGASIFVWQSRMGTDGVRYGSYRWIARQELDRRLYEIEISDYDVSIFWLDEVYDHRLHESVPNGKKSSDDVGAQAPGIEEKQRQRNGQAPEGAREGFVY